MLTYPALSPEAFSLGPITVRWYGLMYLLAFLTAWLLGCYRAKRHAMITPRHFEDILTYGIVGVLAGGRLGYVLFYDPVYFFENPASIFAVWQGGMSFHGGLVGVLVALGVCAVRMKRPFFEVVDFVAPLVPHGLFFGRIGKFLNAELWGRVTTAPVGMVFPGAGPLHRHPSQLYEALGEGLFLFVLLWWFSSTPRPVKAVSGVFAIGYGVMRSLAELFREPDAHLGFIAFNFLSMGMLLSAPLILYGAWLVWQAYHTPCVPRKT